ncbi:hypothetical protein [Nocardia sp. MDA0666]|uniref:hypothetical protein n=1 Tax=Nocardia sp. MDA0666 TaxID=2135448 RepID=UPI001304EC1E|nr:hypothetical protein [Nocardia sp. MDA0666]
MQLAEHLVEQMSQRCGMQRRRPGAGGIQGGQQCQSLSAERLLQQLGLAQLR